MELIKRLPDDDQGVVFVPNEDTMNDIEKTLKANGIKHHAISKAKAYAAEKIEDFQKNKDAEKRKKVLVLNLNDESAAGL